MNEDEIEDFDYFEDYDDDDYVLADDLMVIINHDMDPGIEDEEEE